MDFLSLVKQRQSDRAFDPERTVEPEKLERILEAGRLAPSSCNSQPWHFIVVDDPELKNRVADATSNRILNINHFTKQAPVHIVIVEESANISAGLGGWIKRKHFSPYRYRSSCSAYCSGCGGEGLGSCMLGWFDEKAMRKVLGIPSGKRVILDIVIGYSVQEHRDKKRKPADTIISANHY